MTIMHTNKSINRPKKIFKKKKNIMDLISTSVGVEREAQIWWIYSINRGFCSELELPSYSFNEIEFKLSFLKKIYCVSLSQGSNYS